MKSGICQVANPTQGISYPLFKRKVSFNAFTCFSSRFFSIRNTVLISIAEYNALYSEKQREILIIIMSFF